MIEILLSKLNQIANKLSQVSAIASVDMYGDGSFGNVYYSYQPAGDPPIGYEKQYIGRQTYYLPIYAPAHYKNLYIDANTTLTQHSDYATILVKENLYLNGTIDLSNKHSGRYAASPVVPDSWAKCQMMGEGNFLLNTPFFITGGTGNPIFGNNSRGGGCIVLYYTNLYDAAGVSRNGNFGGQIQVYGGGNAGDNSSGGCLLIAARNIYLGNNGRIKCNGGNGTSSANPGMTLIYHQPGNQI